MKKLVLISSILLLISNAFAQDQEAYRFRRALESLDTIAITEILSSRKELVNSSTHKEVPLEFILNKLLEEFYEIRRESEEESESFKTKKEIVKILINNGANIKPDYFKLFVFIGFYDEATKLIPQLEELKYPYEDNFDKYRAIGASDIQYIPINNVAAYGNLDLFMAMLDNDATFAFKTLIFSSQNPNNEIFDFLVTKDFELSKTKYPIIKWIIEVDEWYLNEINKCRIIKKMIMDGVELRENPLATAKVYEYKKVEELLIKHGASDSSLLTLPIFTIVLMLIFAAFIFFKKEELLNKWFVLFSICAILTVILGLFFLKILWIILVISGGVVFMMGQGNTMTDFDSTNALIGVSVFLVGLLFFFNHRDIFSYFFPYIEVDFNIIILIAFILSIILSVTFFIFHYNRK